MRTTVDIEDDLLTRLRAEATRRRIPFKHLVNRLLRAGVEGGRGAASEPYRCPSHAMGAPVPGVNLEKALDVAAALEDEAVRAKLDLRK